MSGDPGDGQSGLQVNTAAFVVPGIGASYPRHYLRNPGINNHDLPIFKKFGFGGEGSRYLQLRLEMFNFLNHTQYSGYNRTTNIINGSNQAAGMARSIQASRTT